jgi:hypothetical protein
LGINENLHKTGMKTIAFLFLSFISGLSLNVYGQIRNIDLQGEWFTNDDDSLYYKSDTIELFSKTNYFQKLTTCHIIKWIVGRHSFHFESVNRCAQPGIILVAQYIDEESLVLHTVDSKQYIDYYRGGVKMESFEVLYYHEEKVFQNPYNIKTLTLRRIQ